MNNQIDHKIHMKADVSRCPQESADFEKIVMTLLMRKLNRKLKNSTIASEIEVKDSGQIADIGAELKDGWIFWEIQKEANVQFFTKIADRDQKTETETIPVLIKPLIKKYRGVLRKLSEELDQYVLEDEKKY